MKERSYEFVYSTGGEDPYVTWIRLTVCDGALAVDVRDSLMDRDDEPVWAEFTAKEARAIARAFDDCADAMEDRRWGRSRRSTR